MATKQLPFRLLAEKAIGIEKQPSVDDLLAGKCPDFLNSCGPCPTWMHFLDESFGIFPESAHL